jgi:hypothetical protein
MTRSTSEAAFCERMTIFSALAHGLGVANTLASVRFFQDVAYDLMLRDRLAWQVVQELVLVYLSDVDNPDHTRRGILHLDAASYPLQALSQALGGDWTHTKSCKNCFQASNVVVCVIL